MLPELLTERLSVRLARPGMHAAMARFLRENFEDHLAPWSPTPVPGFFHEAFWMERFAAAVDEFRADRAVRFVIQEHTPGVPTPVDADIVGTCNYTNIVRGAFHACHLGYQLSAAHEGRGLMAEALTAANHFMFHSLRMHRIMANYRPENARSERLLLRLGFQREGLAERYLFIDGAWRDHVLTSLLHPRFEDAWLTEPAARR